PARRSLREDDGEDVEPALGVRVDEVADGGSLVRLAGARRQRLGVGEEPGHGRPDGLADRRLGDAGPEGGVGGGGQSVDRGVGRGAHRVAIVPRRRPPRHDRDARGDPGLLAAKAAVRADVWHRLTAAGAARFPGAEGRIPNFAGAAMAADRLRATEAWGLARAVKANPDSPQWPVRQRAL